MKLATMTIGMVLLAGSLSFGQTRPTADMANLERKYQDAQLALTGYESPAREDQLRDLRDELGYLRVKGRRGGTVTAQERRDLSTRFDRFISQLNAARNDGGNRHNSGVYRNPDGTYRNDDRYGRGSGAGYQREIPTGTEVDIRLQTRLDSRDAMVEDRVEGTTMVDLYQGNDLLIPAGSLMVGYVSAVDKATRTDRKGSLSVTFNRITINGRARDMRGSVTEALEAGGIRAEAGRVGAGAGVGAIIGGILGGTKGALAGILIGGGGVLAATEGKDVEVPEGSVLRVRFDSPVPMQH